MSREWKRNEEGSKSNWKQCKDRTTFQPVDSEKVVGHGWMLWEDVFASLGIHIEILTSMSWYRMSDDWVVGMESSRKGSVPWQEENFLGWT